MATEDQLRSMNLRKVTDNDEALPHGSWIRRTAVHTLVKKTYQDDKPRYDGAWFRYENGPSTESTLPRCTLPIVAVRLKAYVPEAGTANRALDMPEEGFLAKKSINGWLKKEMLYTKASQQHFKHLDVAAKKSAYRVHEYAENIPIPALDTTQFIDEFMEIHSSDVYRLRRPKCEGDSGELLDIFD